LLSKARVVISRTATRQVALARSLLAAVVLAATASGAAAQTFPHVPDPPRPADLPSLPGDLRAVAVPEPVDLDAFVKDRAAAVRLGKALFWDMQVGSDETQACASCHFRAGADPRSKNQVSPGLKHAPQPDLTFAFGGPNHQLLATNFPLTKLLIPGQRGALDPLADASDVISSQGVHHLGVDAQGRFEPDPDGFRVAGINVRRVEPRNTPSVINAVYNHRQFWDGRAENVFNGVNHLGLRDPDARVLLATRRKRPPIEVAVAIENSSLASQAVAPIVSAFEMAAPGRTTVGVGRELTRVRGVDTLRPLALQKVHPNDSVLGPLSRWPRSGLTVPTYDQMIKKAFRHVWWKSRYTVRDLGDGTWTLAETSDTDPQTTDYTLLQYNFALFFGLAVQMYEATLVSDDTPWDRFRRTHPSSDDPALNPYTNVAPAHISRQALFGAHLFNDRTRGPTNIRCSNCHELAEMTDASVRRINAAANGTVRNRDGNVIDKGFNNIGLRPTEEDLGVGASDDHGPISHAKALFPDGPPEAFDGASVSKGFGVEGAFKIPSLRNVALTAPYFHNGDVITLRDVVEFYSRGGNVAPIAQMDGTPIEPLGVPALNEDEIDALVAFLESLTDERVLYRRAPFDHPQLFVPNGHPGDSSDTRDDDGDGLADEAIVEIPAVGAEGGTPLPGFLEGPFGP
jgi:cytochrome c peroxidase